MSSSGLCGHLHAHRLTSHTHIHINKKLKIKPKSAATFQVLRLQTFATKTSFLLFLLLLLHVAIVLSALSLLPSFTHSKDDPQAHCTPSHSKQLNQSCIVVHL